MTSIRFLLAFMLLILVIACEPGLGTENDSAPIVPQLSQQGDIYNDIEENPFVQVSEEPISTFSIDADGASYSNVRRFIMEGGQLPPRQAIRTEELINYFNLDYPFTDPVHPISLNGEISDCPWNSQNKLIRIGIKGKPFADNEIPPSNFVFLIDVSGSMSSPDKLELLKTGFKSFVDELKPTDKVAIVTYAGSAGVVLPSTSGDETSTIKNAIDALGSGGSTAGAQGIITAYDIAEQHFIDGGNNRVILGTDGDFNVGASSQEELVTLIESKRDLGIFLTVLGVGRGNLNDAALEQIANNGNGTYEYIDSVRQLEKVFIYEFSKFFTVAKDVKVQIEFIAEHVEAYRLIGYENRLLSTEGFSDDNQDAGEIGANQSITALYEIIPADNIDSQNALTFKIKFRYKLPDSESSQELILGVFNEGNTFNQASDYMKFTAGIASFSMLMTDSQYKGTSNYEDAINWIDDANLDDPYNFKTELGQLVDMAKDL